MSEKSLRKRQPQSDDRRPFINMSWTQTQEADFEEWLTSGPATDGSQELISEILAAGLALKLSPYEESWCATIENTQLKPSGNGYLLSGWSDTWQDALSVAYYKLFVLLEGDWSHPFVSPTKSRRR